MTEKAVEQPLLKPAQALITIPPELRIPLAQIVLDVSAKAGRRVNQKDVIVDLLQYAVMYPEKVRYSSLEQGAES